ncbi:MAG: CopG family transcriptional regulator [Acidobacteria bacterium]|nr:CopG family transcriptional regulator [Acidobacteriota bacterium]
MRTTLEIEDDVLQAAKELARREGKTAGKVISILARKALTMPDKRAVRLRKGKGTVPQLPSRGEVITSEHVRDLMQELGD